MSRVVEPQHPAFPGLPDLPCPGLTKRELFALVALHGVLAGSNPEANYPDHDDVARWCVDYADALLARLNRPD